MPRPSRSPAAARCLHELFEAQAARTPGAVAVEHGTSKQTYTQLDEAANRLAHRLRAAGAGPESRVGLSIERCPEMVVAILGILKAGAAFVPLEPTLPAERRAFVLKDAGVKLVVSSRRLLEEVPLAGVETVSVDEPWEGSSSCCQAPPAGGPSLAGLAYVLYTSGSTGRPKGVEVMHRTVARQIEAVCRIFGLGPEDRLLQFASLSFDISLEQVFCPLAVGAALVLRPEELGTEQDLLRFLAEARVTVANLPPIVWQRLADASAAEPEAIRGHRLRLMVVGGDLMRAEPASRWQRLWGSELINAYGPTEATITSTMYRVPARGPEASGRSSIALGWPVGSRSVRVLGRRLERVLQGAHGELCVGGDWLARGYLGRPALTAEKFVPDPWSAEPGGRLYRTGDLGRHLADGRLDFAGRIDHQVKIRGQRVEPGEVEAVLERCAEVAEAAVAVRRDAAGRRRLVAFLVPAPGVSPDLAVLREHLRPRLAAAMMPSAFAVLEELPLLPSGKVNRRALPRVDVAASALAEGLVAPRDQREELIAEIWAEVLGLERVGVDSNFFDLGGHSLLAARVLTRLRGALGVELPLRTLFRDPTVARLAQAVVEARCGAARPLPPLERLPRGGELPASFAQERLWFLQRLDPASAAYNLPTALELAGSLDARGLERALGMVVGRHESLRTRLEQRRDRLFQVVDPPPRRFPLPVVDLQGLAGPDRLPEARRLAGAAAGRPFDLGADSMLRPTLVRLAAERHAVLLIAHHAASDGWSAGILVRELAGLYSAFRTASSERALVDSAAALAAAGLPALPIQYADFAAWQRGWLSEEVLDAGIEAWRGRLAGAPPVLELPTDRPRPAVETPAGAVRTFSLPAGLVAALHRLGRSRGATLFMTLLAAFKAVLGRLSGAVDISVGSPVADRGRVEVENLIGLFINTLVLRTDQGDDPRFADFLARVREVAFEALEHGNVPFEKLVEDLAPRRCLAHSPLVQTMLVLQNAPREGLELPGLEVGPFAAAGEVAAKLDLTLIFDQGTGGDRALSGTLEYKTDLFDATTAERLVRGFLRLLEDAASRPAARLSELRLLGAAERQALCLEHNDTARDLQYEATLPALLAARIAEHPERIAVSRQGESLTYGELGRLSGRIASRLAGLGVGPEIRVGVALERGPVLVAALLGVLRSGGAYVPLDPTLPASRLAFLAEDSGLAAVLTEEGLRARVAGIGAPLLVLEGVLGDPDSGASEPSGHHPFTSPARAENLAYAIYTSGSTGRPKGVEISHRALVNLLESMASSRGLGPDGALLAVTRMSFDIAGLELFGPLVAGGRVEIASAAEAADGRLLQALLAASGATAMQATPATWRLLVESGWQGDGRLRILCGGEALPADLAEALCARGAAWNLYGPTEATVWSAAEPLTPRGRVTIGRPITNTSLGVADRALRPVGLGVVGELWIGGEGLARGYLGRPALTAERFVPNPFSEGGLGARLYRTGDLARRLADGRLECLGRLDSQVKVRGFRIEIGEVESALLELPGVEAAAVVLRAGELVAYLVGEEDRASGLRQGLREKLPDYMVPAAFTFVETLPQTPNGKLDRHALALAGPSPGAATRSMAPDGPVEELLAGIWAEVLGRPAVGADDDFFALGGHSLLAARALARVLDTFGVELPMRTFFETPTLRRLARRLDAVRARAEVSGLEPPPPLVPRGVEAGEPPLSFAQQRLWLLHQVGAVGGAYNLPVGVGLRGGLEPRSLARALGEVVGRHEALRAVFPKRSGEPRQAVSPAAAVPLPAVDLSGLPGAVRQAEIGRLRVREAARAFDLRTGPLYRFRLVRLADEEHALVATLHHIVGDELSLAILWRELAALYGVFHSGVPSPLAELPIQYADFAAWQRSWLAGERLMAEAALWRERLEGIAPTLELPADRPRPAVQTFHGAVRSHALPEQLAEALAAYARGSRATLFMVVLAAFETLTGRISGQKDFCVGTPVAGRGRIETEGLIGCFVNTLALRADLRDDPPFARLLARTREEALEAFAHAELPFEAVVEALSPRRSLAHTPLFQVTFQLLHRLEGDGGAAVLPGLEARPLAVETATSKFDLSLTATVGDGRPGGGTLVLGLEHNTDLFDSTTAGRLLGHLETLLDAVCRNDGGRLSELPLLRRVERAQLLREWNDSESPWGEAWAAVEAVHQLVERRAAEVPDALAVAADAGQLSYGRLDRWAAHLARRLRHAGAGPEVLVALCARPGLGFVAGALAILKAGAAYLPLDPDQPPDRLRALLADAWKDQPRPILVTDAAAAEILAGHGGIELRVEKPAAGDAADEDARGRPPLVRGANLAYAIYTSGSTGRPKRVLLTHRGLLNLVAWHLRTYRVTAADRASLLASPAFDASVWEIWPYLAAGASLHVPAEPEIRRCPRRLRSWLEAEGVTLAFLCTPMTECLLREGPWPRTLRAALTGGEKLHTPCGALPATAVVNHYGPTESTVVATAGRVTASSDRDPSIGRPIANQRAYVLSRRGLPVPVGVPGELSVGGTGPARGYDRRAGLTAEKLVPDPFSGVPGARLYRTGDLVRWLAGGELEFLQRIDDQVKVRGFRVQPGEIEAVLSAHPGVCEAVVLARSEPAGGKSLTAFFTTPTAAAPPPVAQLRSFLGGRLPAYMVPARMTPVDALPRTPSGKVDRGALLARDTAERAAREAASATPDRDVEKVLAALWAEVLGVERVGIHDDFFALGGHSIQAMRLLARLEDTFRFEVSLRQLFGAATVDGLAAVLERWEPVPGQVEKIARALLKVKAMSPEEMTARLGRCRATGKTK